MKISIVSMKNKIPLQCLSNISKGGHCYLQSWPYPWNLILLSRNLSDLRVKFRTYQKTYYESDKNNSQWSALRKNTEENKLEVAKWITKALTNTLTKMHQCVDSSWSMCLMVRSISVYFLVPIYLNTLWLRETSFWKHKRLGSMLTTNVQTLHCIAYKWVIKPKANNQVLSRG